MFKQTNTMPLSLFILISYWRERKQWIELFTLTRVTAQFSNSHDRVYSVLGSAYRLQGYWKDTLFTLPLHKINLQDFFEEGNKVTGWLANIFLNAEMVRLSEFRICFSWGWGWGSEIGCNGGNWWNLSPGCWHYYHSHLLRIYEDIRFFLKA